jgi:hypothetical protein
MLYQIHGIIVAASNNESIEHSTASEHTTPPKHAMLCYTALRYVMLYQIHGIIVTASNNESIEHSTVGVTIGVHTVLTHLDQISVCVSVCLCSVCYAL